MKKKILSIFLAFCLIFSLLPMGAMADEAQSGTCGDDLTWVLENSVLTISGTGKMDDYGLKDAPWHDARDVVTGIVIGDGVTSIGNSAFRGFYALTSVTIGKKVASIGDWAFGQCAKLGDVTLPGGLKTIGGTAFSGCVSLKSVVIPDSVTSIGGFAFSGCIGMASVKIGSNVTSIGENAFNGCVGLTKVVIPEGVKSIEVRTFSGCTKLETVVIPKTIAKIGDNTFAYCSSLADIAFGGTKDAWTAMGYTFPVTSTVRVHYNCTTLDGHYIPVDVKEATCTSAGYVKYLCSCGYEYTEIIPGGHDYVVVKTVDATCVEHGYDLLKCKKCGAEKKDYKDDELGEHTYVDKVVEPACLTGGYTEHKCSVCGSSYKDSLVQPLGHSYKGGVCTRCGAVDASFRPDAPQLKITTASGHPKIYWDAVDGAAKYWVYRSTDGVNFKYYDSTTKTSYTNSSTSIGTTYYYKVKAVAVLNGKNVTSDYSVVKSIRCRPAAVNLSIYRVNGKPKLSWKAVSGATKYWIYRSTDGVNFSYYDSTTKLSYTNSAAASGTRCYYRVKAVAVVNGKNVASAYSNSKNLMTSLAAPSVSITTSNGKPKITWKAVTGADKYYIYRSTDGKTFSYWDATANLSYTNLSASKNTKYYYKVKAVCAMNSNANSAQSAAVSIKAIK